MAQPPSPARSSTPCGALPHRQQPSRTGSPARPHCPCMDPTRHKSLPEEEGGEERKKQKKKARRRRMKKNTNNKVSLQAKRRRRRSGRAGGRRLTPAPSLQRPTSGPTGRIGPAAGRIGPAADRIGLGCCCCRSRPAGCCCSRCCCCCHSGRRSRPAGSRPGSP